MTTTITLPSPCKINLFLHINQQRPDGYHELQTLFQLLDYGDTLSFQLDDGLTVRPALPGVKAQDNLVHRAATALQQATGCHLGASITITKSLPMGGGLGGGSSNAATTLLALNYLWSTQLSLTELAEIGLALGADVPVFIHGLTAWGEGIGEMLTPIALSPQWYLVLKPDCQVNTAEIFSAKRLTRDTPKLKIAPALERDITRFHNDCEAIVCQKYSAVAQALEWLNQFARAKLTGTGACVFASFPSKSAALEVLGNRPRHIEGFVAQGINESTLHAALTHQHQP